MSKWEVQKDASAGHPGIKCWLRPAKRVVKASHQKTILNEKKITITSAKKKRKARDEEEKEEEADKQHDVFFPQ